MANGQPQNHRQPQRHPGMYPQQPRLRSLRIGVILGGKIIEEKLIRKRDQITIGQSSKNTFSIPIESVPRQWPLFMVKDDAYYLYFSDTMDGRISDGSNVQPLANLRQQGAQRYNEGWVMRLPETSRGKIVLGDMTLLFQFVTAPPLQPRPHLPASVRGSIADRIDPQLAIIMAVSIALHFSVFIYARQCVDPPLSKSAQIYKETFPDEYEDTFEPQVAEVDVEVPEGEGEAEKPEDEGQEKPDKPDKPEPNRGDEKPDDGGGTDRPAKSDEEMAQDAELAIAGMFGEDDPDSQTSGTRMADRNPGFDLADEAENVEEGRTKVTLEDQGDNTGPSREKRRRASTSGPDVDAPGGREDSGDTGPAKVPKKPDVDVGRPDVDEQTNLSPSAILAKIRRQYTYGLKQCFKKVLKMDETASGTIKLKFKIGERGNVTRSKVTRGFGYDTLDRCVESQALKWRFNPPRDADGDPTEMTVALSLPFTGR